jgi:cytochrome d ubiquinol oxidase subunit I
VQPWLARVLIAMTFTGWLATLAGWYVTEVGRQPYLVYGVLTTAQAAAQMATPMVASTLAMYLTVYVALIMAYVSALFHMARKAGQDAPILPTTANTAKRPSPV